MALLLDISLGVVLEGVDPVLIALAELLSNLHGGLFGKPLVVTSGRDGQHAAGSLHAEGKALDFRTNDKTDAENLLWAIVVVYLAPHYHCTVFDERALPGAPHTHVEYHGKPTG